MTGGSEEQGLAAWFAAGSRVLCAGCGSLPFLTRLIGEAGAVPFAVEPDPALTEQARLAGVVTYCGTWDGFRRELLAGGPDPDAFRFDAAVLGPPALDPALPGWEAAPQQIPGLLTPGRRLFTLQSGGEIEPARPPQAAVAPGAGRRPIVYLTALYNASGYASESRAFIKELVARGYTVQVIHAGVRQENTLSAEDLAFFRRLEATGVEPEQAVHITALPPVAAFAPAYPLTILRTMFETDRIPAQWVDQCNQFAEVWVPAEHSHRAFAASGVSPGKLRVVRGGVDATLFHPACKPLPLPLHRDCRFLSVFDWQFRKGWDLLLAAYVAEFRPEEPVVLYLKVSQLSKFTAINAEVRYYLEQVLKRAPEQTPDIVLLPFDLPETEMPGLYTAASAFVLPSRGEGYGRPYLEAMACGLPVIGTAWGGQADFLTEANGFPLPISGLEAVPDHEPVEVFAGLTWALPSLSELRRLMRYLFEHPGEAERRGRAARETVEQGWDLRVAADQMERELARFCAGA